MPGAAVGHISLLPPCCQPSQRLLALVAGTEARGCGHFVPGKPVSGRGCHSLAAAHAPGSGGGRERRTCTAHFLYICGAITFKCLGCKPATRSPDSPALLHTL